MVIHFGIDIVVIIKDITAVNQADPLSFLNASILYAGAGRQEASFNCPRGFGMGGSEIKFIVGVDTKLAPLHWGSSLEGARKAR